MPGRRLDPPPRPEPEAVQRFGRTRPWAQIGWDAGQRFKQASVTLMAGGTAYYGFVALFSLLAVVYGVAALVDAEHLADWMTRSLEQALPGLVGEDGIDPASLEALGRTSSVLGLLLLLWSGSAVMVATTRSLREIYGAPAPPFNPVALRVRMLGWLAVIGPLIVGSYALTAFGPLATLATLTLDIAITGLLLGYLGGVRPPSRPLLLGAVVGAVIIGVLKTLMAAIVAWSLDKPQYGSFTVPVAVLVVVWLQALALYGAACLTASAATQ